MLDSVLILSFDSQCMLCRNIVHSCGHSAFEFVLLEVRFSYYWSTLYYIIYVCQKTHFIS